MFNSRLMQNDTAVVNRLTKTWAKQTWFTTIVTLKWYFKVISANNQSVWINQYGRLFHFTCEYWADIKKNDVLTINLNEYTVSWVGQKRWLRVSYTRAILILKDN